MWQKFKDAFISKKFFLVVVGSAVCYSLQHFGVSAEVIAIVGSLFGVNIAGVAVKEMGTAK